MSELNRPNILNSGRSFLAHIIHDVPSVSVNGTVINNQVYCPNYQERAAYGADNLKSFMSIKKVIEIMNDSGFFFRDTNLGDELKIKLSDFTEKYFGKETKLSKMIGDNVASFFNSKIKNTRTEFRSELLELIKGAENLIKNKDSNYTLEKNRVDLDLMKSIHPNDTAVVCTTLNIGRSMRSAQVNFNKGNILDNSII